jgi:hypothetical protein
VARKVPVPTIHDSNDARPLSDETRTWPVTFVQPCGGLYHPQLGLGTRFDRGALPPATTPLLQRDSERRIHGPGTTSRRFGLFDPFSLRRGVRAAAAETGPVSVAILPRPPGGAHEKGRRVSVAASAGTYNARSGRRAHRPPLSIPFGTPGPVGDLRWSLARVDQATLRARQPLNCPSPVRALDPMAAPAGAFERLLYVRSPGVDSTSDLHSASARRSPSRKNHVQRPNMGAPPRQGWQSLPDGRR